MREAGGPERIDTISLAEHLERRQLLESIGGDAYLAQVYATAIGPSALDLYLDSVVDCYVLRRLIEAGASTVARCFEAGEDLDGVIDDIEREVLQATQLRIAEVPYQTMRELLRDAITFLEMTAARDPQAIGIPTGFPDVDRVISGLRPGDMVVLAARPSIGKTTFAMNIAANVAAAGHGVGVFSLEMGAAQLAMRLLCAEAKFSLVDVRDGRITSAQYEGRIAKAVERLTSMPIYVDDTPQITSLELRQKARRMKVEHGIGLIVIDYLQLMRPTGGGKNSNREQDVARLSNDIKALAKELNVPIMILAQLNRQAELGGKPKLAHLRESGAIEQDADLVLMLHRDREAAEMGGQAGDDGAPSGAIGAELIVAKHRNGPTGDVPLWFFPAWTRFEGRARVEDQDVPRPSQAGGRMAGGQGYPRAGGRSGSGGGPAW